MNTALALLLAVSLDGAVGDVGAPYPQLAVPVTQNLAVASAETGASRSWAAQPGPLASLKQTQEFEMVVEGFDAKLSQELDHLIAQKLESLITYE